MKRERIFCLAMAPVVLILSPLAFAQDSNVDGFYSHVEASALYQPGKGSGGEVRVSHGASDRYGGASINLSGGQVGGRTIGSIDARVRGSDGDIIVPIGPQVSYEMTPNSIRYGGGFGARVSRNSDVAFVMGQWNSRDSNNGGLEFGLEARHVQPIVDDLLSLDLKGRGTIVLCGTYAEEAEVTAPVCNDTAQAFQGSATSNLRVGQRTQVFARAELDTISLLRKPAESGATFPESGSTSPAVFSIGLKSSIGD